MRNEEVDLSGLPEIPPEKFAWALICKGLQPVVRKAQITLRIDADVLEWFRERGAGYQSRMNAVLRAYKQAHERLSLSSSFEPLDLFFSNSLTEPLTDRRQGSTQSRVDLPEGLKINTSFGIVPKNVLLHQH